MLIAHELLDFGAKRRAVGATQMNATSSRSHAVFTLQVRMVTSRPGGHIESQAWLQNSVLRCFVASLLRLEAKVHFVDLAGSEREGHYLISTEQFPRNFFRLVKERLVKCVYTVFPLVFLCCRKWSSKKTSTKKRPDSRDQDDFGSYLHVVGKRGEPGRAGQFVIEELLYKVQLSAINAAKDKEFKEMLEEKDTKYEDARLIFVATEML
eukprot:Skav226391  [mRNA]  locus=scaffold1631:82615:92597:+ [translate_table: standard]